MDIEQIMKRLDDSRKVEQQSIKVASAESGNGQSQNNGALRQALRETLASAPSAGTEKTASAGGPEGDLMKLAEDLTNAEQEAILKQAQVFGAAVCDGFMTRYAQYEGAAAEVAPEPTKTASVQPQTPDQEIEMIKTAAADPAFQKFASENPDLVKEAFDLGYQQTWNGLVKQADADFTQGYNDTMEEVHKVASDIYKLGEAHTVTAIRTAQAQPQQ